MGKQLSRALETRPSVSGTHSKNARVARRVARAGLTTGGSSDDTMDDLLKPFLRRLSWPLFLFLSLVLWILGLRSDTFFRTRYIFVLGPAISNLTPSSPNPQACAHIPSVPRNPTFTTHTYILYSIHHACVDSLLHSHFFFILLYQSRLIVRDPSCHLDLCSILYSPFVPIALP